MKKIVVFLIGLFFILNATPAHAGIIANHKAKIQQEKELKAAYNDIKTVIEKQGEVSNKYDVEGLKKLYADNFINSDGMNKEVYFKLVEDTWKNYPNITYKTKFKDIDFNEKYAKIEVYETAFAILETPHELVTVSGEMLSAANTLYFLEKVNGKWLITSEYIIDEKSVLRYGAAKYLDMNLYSPLTVKAGEQYSVSLKVNAPEDAVVVASIGSAKATYPQVKIEDAFRKMPEDQTLERLFNANKDNVNEYTMASVGIARAEQDGYNMRVYMDGIAFIMTRVNVVPFNKFIDLKKAEEENGKTK